MSSRPLWGRERGSDLAGALKLAVTQTLQKIKHELDQLQLPPSGPLALKATPPPLNINPRSAPS